MRQRKRNGHLGRRLVSQSFSFAVSKAMNVQLIISYWLLVTSTSVICVVDKNSKSVAKPPLQVENLPWKSHFEYQSPTEYYNEHEFEENDELIERRNPGGPNLYTSPCPPRETGQFPYPPDCRRFINCWKGRSSIQMCAPGTLFNPETRECDHPGKVHCKNDEQEEQFMAETERYVRFPHERPSIAYNQRVARNQNNDRNGPSRPAKPYPGPPPYFGPSHLKPQTRPTRQPLSHGPSKVQCPLGASGLYPHPNDCSKFIKCWSGGTFIQNCGPGTLFNPRISACDHPHNVACSHEGSHFPEEPLEENTDEEILEESIRNEKFVAFDNNEKDEAKKIQTQINEQQLVTTTRVPAVSSTPKSDAPAHQTSGNHFTEATNPQRHPKIINVGTKEKPSLGPNAIPTYLTPPTEEKTHASHSRPQTVQPNQYTSFSTPTPVPQDKKPSFEQYPTHYPSHGPYSQSHNLNFLTQDGQPAFNIPYMDNHPTRQEAHNPYNSHTSYVQRHHSHGHHQHHHHSQIPQVQEYHTMAQTWLQPPPFSHQKPVPYAPNYISGQGSSNTLHKSLPCPPKTNPNNPYEPSAPNCESGANYYPFRAQDSTINAYPGFPSFNYPYLPTRYSNILSQVQPIPNPKFPPPHYPTPMKGNALHSPSYGSLNVPSQPIQPGSTYGSNFHTLNSPYRPFINSIPQTTPQSQQVPSANYYPFYVLQHLPNQSPNSNQYSPQLQFHPMPASDNTQYPSNSTNIHQPNNYPIHSTTHATTPWDASTNLEQQQTSSTLQHPAVHDSSPGAPAQHTGTVYGAYATKKMPEITTDSIHPLSLHGNHQENTDKNYILNKIDVRTGEEIEATTEANTPIQSEEDVESFDISVSKPNKYSEPEDDPQFIGQFESDVTFTPPPQSPTNPPNAQPLEKPTVRIRQTPPNGQRVRLRNGATHLDGYLEMKNDEGNQWGLICDQVGAWNIEEASVACRELGFVRGAELSWQGYPIKSDEENIQVAVESINCTGSEGYLSECQVVHGNAGKCNVGRNAVGLRCFDNLASHCQAGEILYNRYCYKLHGKENPDDPGIKTEEASGNCKKFGGKLVDITSQYENDFISEWLVKKHPEINSVVTGGIGISVLGRPMWIWEGTSDPMVFERWWSGWTGNQKIPKGSINGPLCIVLKKTFSCNETEDETRKEKSQDEDEETCSADYFFWDVEDCNNLQTAVYICKRPMDDIGCVIGAGEGYLGTANTTASGQACLPWDHPKAVEGLARRASARERSARLVGHNYCRNLGNPDRHPWCFVEGKGNSEYCAIPQCWDSDNLGLRGGKLSGYHRSYDAFSSCDQNQFECKPGECIKKAWVCDGQKDCSNHRDEEMCKVYYQEFKVFRNKMMKGTGKAKWANVNENTCSKLCLENKNFKCRSFSYSLKGKFCLLSDTNRGLSGHVVNQSGWVYHELISEAFECTIENGYFGCGNGKCVNISNVCDGKKNCADASDEKDCGQLGYQIRLSGSNEKYKGRVEVKVLGKWGVVCDDMFDLRDANVVCKELGFQKGASEVLQHSYYPVKDPLFLVDDLDCLGNETSIRECAFPGWGKHNCGAEESVGVICRITGSECGDGQWRCKSSKECISMDYLCDDIPDCDDKSDESAEYCRSPTQIRLSDGPNEASGRVEVRHFGVWGTVCDDDFNMEAAQVVCRLLGYHGSAEVKKNAYFGAGKGPIWLDEVHCTGTERTLEECAYPHWGRNNCKHDEDVGVICRQDSERATAPSPIASVSSDESVPSAEEKLRKALMAECGGKSKASYRVTPYERVLGGTNVARESVPWQASIRVKSGGGKSIHWCGAIVISPYHILTAGHCLRDYNKAAYFIRVGDYDTEVEDPHEQQFTIDHLYIHSNFSKKVKLNNDIGLVKIKGEIRLSDHVRPACLAASLDMYSPGTNCTVSGWGSVSAHSTGFARTLRWAHVPILEASVCRAPFVYGDSLSEGMFCAGQLDGGVDSCQGDSGGPLTCRHEGREYLFGITSWGHGCGRANKPGVYTNVAYYAEWIQEKIKSSLM